MSSATRSVLTMCHVHHLECRLQDLQQHRQRLRKRGIRQQYIYFCSLTVRRADVQAFMAEHPEYTKANRFKDIEVKVYI